MKNVLDGVRVSPFMVVRFVYLALKFAYGRHIDEDNYLRWDKIILNLPGSKDFNPMLPWVIKWNNKIDNVASSMAIFIDDLRVMGIDEEVAWASARQILSRLQYLGIHVALRKTRPPMRHSDSVWAGIIFQTSGTRIQQLVSQEKWDKCIENYGRNYISYLLISD